MIRAWLGDTPVELEGDAGAAALAEEWLTPIAERPAGSAGALAEGIRLRVTRGTPEVPWPERGTPFDVDGIDGRVDESLLVLRSEDHRLVATHREATLEYGYRESPSRDAFLFGWAVASRARGWHHLHAAALRLADGRRTLLVGGTRSGKTTTALTLALRGATWGADDCVFVHDDGRIAPVPRAFFVRERTHRALPELSELATPELRRGETRYRVDVGAATGVPPERLWSGVDLAIFPSVTHQADTDALPCTEAEGLGVLLESSPYVALSTLPNPTAGLTALAGVLRGVPCLRLGLGLDALQDTGLVARMLARV